jgi:hypothetical protein
MVMSDMMINATWETRQLTKPFKDLLREPLITMLDCMLAIGFAAWRWTTAQDAAGQKQSVPYVLCPTTGTFYAYWKEEVLVDMKFVTVDEGGQWHAHDVAMLRTYAPERSGALRSPLSNVLMRMYLCATVQNAEAQAMSVCSRPPLVLEQGDTKWLDASAIDDYDDNGGGTIERASHDAAAIAMQQAMRIGAGSSANAAAGGSAAEAAGSGLYVPDPFTGMWPAGTRGAFVGNKCHLPAGFKLVHQEMPRSISDSEKWRTSAERTICNMFGVSSTLLYPDNATARFKSSIDDAIKMTRSLALANLRWAALMLQGVLNKMYQAADSAKIALDAIEAAKAVGAMPEKIGKSAARAILRVNRYRVKVSFGHSANADELFRMYHDGLMSLSSYKLMMSQHYGMDVTALDGDGVPPPVAPPQPAAPPGSEPPAKKKQKQAADGDK